MICGRGHELAQACPLYPGGCPSLFPHFQFPKEKSGAKGGQRKRSHVGRAEKG